MNTEPDKSLLIVGPLPPPPTGPHVAFQHFCDEVESRFGAERIAVIDSSQKIMKKNVTRIASLGNLKQACRIAMQFRRKLKKADHVLVFGSNGFMLAMAPILLVMAKLRKKPVYMRPFGGSLDQYAANLNPILRRILVWTLRNADGLSVQTEMLRSGLTGMVGENIQVAPNYRYVPEHARTDRSRGDATRELRLIYLGIVSEPKGVFVLMDAMRQLAEQGARVRCDIFGPLAPASAERFEREVAGAENVDYKGTLRPGDAIAAMTTYDALVLPTFYQGEGHPGVIIEAMMAGVPVISTRHRSIPELVEDGVNGLLVAPRDVASLTAAIDRLERDREFLAELGKASWESRNRFDTHRVVSTILHQMGVASGSAPEVRQECGVEAEASPVH